MSISCTTVDNTRRITANVEAVMDGVTILGYHIGIRSIGVTTGMNIDGPHAVRVGRHNLIGYTMSVGAIAATTACELFEDDVPVGRIGSNIDGVAWARRSATTVDIKLVGEAVAEAGT